jgi:hypothetical protein
MKLHASPSGTDGVIQRTGVRGATKEQRRLHLMSAFGSVVDAAWRAIGKIKDLLQILTDHMNTLTIQDASSLPQVAEPPTVMSTIMTAATAGAAPTVTQEEEDENIPIAHLGAANPRTAKHQRQKRLQPQSAAPTTKGYKAVARRGERTRKDSVKRVENKLQGKTEEGKHKCILVLIFPRLSVPRDDNTNDGIQIS